MRIEEGRDWWLPADVTRDRDSGFYQLTVNKSPTDKLPIISPGGVNWSWRELNPSENVYRFDLIKNKLAEVQGTPYAVGLRIKCSESRFVPDWVIQKHRLSTVSLSGGAEYICPWHAGVEADFFRFLQELGKTGIPNDPKVVFSQIHGISSSQGEEMGLKTDDQRLLEGRFGLSPDVFRNWATKRIDAWVEAFGSAAYKLMWAGDENALRLSQNDSYHQASQAIVDHALSRGIGFRGGIIEMYYGKWMATPRSTGYQLLHDGNTGPYYEVYFERDWAHLAQAGHCVLGDENEEYWSGDGKWGDTETQRNHRWFMSNLAALACGIRFLYTTDFAYDLDPAFSDYVQRSLGKTVKTSVDAWAALTEGYRTSYVDGRWRDTAVKNWERFLYQRDLPGAMTTPVEQVTRQKAGGEKMQNPPWGDGQPFDFAARRTDRASGNDRIYFRVERRWYTPPQPVSLKVTYRDNAAHWHVEYDAGAEGIRSTEPVVGTNDGKWKTATFELDDAAFAGGLPQGQDMAIVADQGDVVVQIVRIIKGPPRVSESFGPQMEERIQSIEQRLAVAETNLAKIIEILKAQQAALTWKDS